MFFRDRKNCVWMCHKIVTNLLKSIQIAQFLEENNTIITQINYSEKKGITTQGMCRIYKYFKV
jgi:hypothetical protein